ncbi:hypothetical protein MR060_14045 [bacterium]|nr:hypothetical protein [bacterium]
MAKFPLRMNGVDVYDIDALKKNFDIQTLVDNRTKLAGWLKGADEEELAQKVKALSHDLSNGGWLDAVAPILGIEAELAHARELIAEKEREEEERRQREEEARRQRVEEARKQREEEAPKQREEEERRQREAEKTRQAQLEVEKMTSEEISLLQEAMKHAEKNGTVESVEDLAFALKNWRYFAVVGELAEQVKEILSLSQEDWVKMIDALYDTEGDEFDRKDRLLALRDLRSIKILSGKGIQFAVSCCASDNGEILLGLSSCTLLDEGDDIVLLESTYLYAEKSCLTFSSWEGDRFHLELKGYCPKWKGEVSPSSPCSSWTPCE